MKKIFLACLVLVGFHSQAAVQYSPQKPTVQFVAVGKPSMLKIKGKTDQMQGAIHLDGQTIKGQLSVPLLTLDTGIDTRDEHMKKKYLETDKYPNAVLKIDQMTLPANSLSGQKNEAVPFQGTLELHGVVKPVSGVMSFQGQDNRISVSAKYQVKLTDHQIDIPSYLGIKVADVVDIETEMTLTKTQ
ncbi:MAG: hypothetical protein FMNOHCHN_03604 [Ignavibacteriaceae bacterium]|nr:hypothetical protein [Ignavibacteriaceae bacterium]GIL17942.1 MAG: hypothetical protein BroJett040_16930 [Oligoflexia bacterium]